MKGFFSTRLEVRARRELCFLDRIDLTVFERTQRDNQTIFTLGQPIIMSQVVNPELLCVVPVPTLSMPTETAQQLIDELWRCGLRPTEGSGSAGSLAATERHLEDMRKLVFSGPARTS